MTLSSHVTLYVIHHIILSYPVRLMSYPDITNGISVEVSGGNMPSTGISSSSLPIVKVTSPLRLAGNSSGALVVQGI